MGFADTLKRWFGMAREGAGEAADKAGDVAGAAWEKSKDVAEKAGETAGAAWEKAKDVADDDEADTGSDAGESDNPHA